jgi:enolase
MFKIKRITSRAILDSRGNPTVETDVFLKNACGRAAVPSGASVGTYEALELRDKNKQYHGMGVDKAVKNVKEIIAPKLVNNDIQDQEELDALLCKLDGTVRKVHLGANAILSCSMAFAVAAAANQKIPLYEYIGKMTKHKFNILPVPAMNVINGGRHADNDIDIQEHMILPLGAKSFREAMRMGSEVYFLLKKLLRSRHGKASINVGDEGGFAPPLSDPNEPLEIIEEAIGEMGYNDKIKIGLDCAASEFYNKDKKVYSINKKNYTNGELVDFYSDLVSKYSIISLEDPFAEDDWEGFINITKKLGRKIQVVGDDLFVTNMQRLQKGISTEAGNNNYGVMVSHRSGETEDTFIADLVVGLKAGQIKSGAPARSDRTAKYNQLLRIEEGLDSKAVYAGKNFRQLS